MKVVCPPVDPLRALKTPRIRSLVLLTALAGLCLLLVSCGRRPPSEGPAATEPGPNLGGLPSGWKPPSEYIPTSGGEEGPTVGGPDELSDLFLAQAAMGNLAYNVPPSLELDGTAIVQLLLSPNQPETELEASISEEGEVITATLRMMPVMKAELRAADAEAFDIQALHADAAQPISLSDPTEWKWTLQARKGGDQTLVLTIYRPVEHEGQEYWFQKSYENTISVRVTLAKRLQQFDWKWIVGILLTALVIPAIWRWVDSRQKKANAAKPGTGRD